MIGFINDTYSENGIYFLHFNVTRQMSHMILVGYLLSFLNIKAIYNCTYVMRKCLMVSLDESMSLCMVGG